MLSGLLGAVAGKGLVAGAKGIMKLFTDYKQGKIKQEQFLANLENELPRLQNQVNLAEANHPSLFVSGWRPFVGWTCGGGLFYQYLLAPLSNGVLSLAGYTAEFPTLDLATLVPILVGMLGLAGYRSFEKTKDKARD